MINVVVFNNDNIPKVGDCPFFVALVILHYKKRM